MFDFWWGNLRLDSHCRLTSQISTEYPCVQLLVPSSHQLQWLPFRLCWKDINLQSWQQWHLLNAKRCAGGSRLIRLWTIQNPSWFKVLSVRITRSLCVNLPTFASFAQFFLVLLSRIKREAPELRNQAQFELKSECVFHFHSAKNLPNSNSVQCKGIIWKKSGFELGGDNCTPCSSISTPRTWSFSSQTDTNNSEWESFQMKNLTGKKLPKLHMYRSQFIAKKKASTIFCQRYVQSSTRFYHCCLCIDHTNLMSTSKKKSAWYHKAQNAWGQYSSLFSKSYKTRLPKKFPKTISITAQGNLALVFPSWSEQSNRRTGQNRTTVSVEVKACLTGSRKDTGTADRGKRPEVDSCSCFCLWFFLNFDLIKWEEFLLQVLLCKEKNEIPLGLFLVFQSALQKQRTLEIGEQERHTFMNGKKFQRQW